jgi:hypothetical protein
VKAGPRRNWGGYEWQQKARRHRSLETDAAGRESIKAEMGVNKCDVAVPFQQNRLRQTA